MEQVFTSTPEPAQKAATAGFTLVEVLIVVGIIGGLCAIAIPSFSQSRTESRVSRMTSDLRIVYDAFNMYAMENGNYPAGIAQGASTPVPVAEFLSGTKWTSPTALGGGWWYISMNRWDPSAGAMVASRLILVDNFNFGGAGAPMAAASAWQKIDAKIDDGNLNRGRFKLASGIQVQYSVDDKSW